MMLAVYSLADRLMDEGQKETARVLNMAAATADQRLKWIEKLAWACKEKTATKRNNALQAVLAEMDHAEESLAGLPLREYPAA